MIERVARALMRNVGGQRATALDQTEKPLWEARTEHENLEAFVEANWLNAVSEARTALEAMREPTAEMMAAFERSMARRTNYPLAIRAMFDAALAEAK